MRKFKYQDQLQTIKQLYNQGETFASIARILNPFIEDVRVTREASCIKHLLSHELGNVPSNQKCVITDEVKQRIADLIKQGKTPKDIAKILNIKYPTIGSYLQKKGFKFKPDPGNIHYFETIDTHAKAYILGFIAADGALVPAKHGPTVTLTITIKYEDKALLEFIKSEIGNTHKLLEIRRPSNFDSSKEVHHIRLAMSTPQIVHDIMKYGITPRKSLTLCNVLENIPYEFRDAFIIGYFDGNGSVHIEEKPRLTSSGYYCEDNSLYINIRASKSLLEGICNHLRINPSHIYQHDSIPTLSFANKNDTYRFYRCYENLPFYYKRKHDKFLKKISHPSYDKYKQVQTISSPTSTM